MLAAKVSGAAKIGSASGPAKNFHLGDIAIPLFATWMMDRPALATPTPKPTPRIPMLASNKPGVDRLGEASNKAPNNVPEPLLAARNWSEAANAAANSGFAVECPRSISSLVPGRGADPSSLVNCTATWKPHAGSAATVVVTSKK